MAVRDSDGFGGGSDSDGFGRIPSSPAREFFATLYNPYGILTLQKWVRILTDSVESRIRMDSDGFQDPKYGSRQPRAGPLVPVLYTVRARSFVSARSAYSARLLSRHIFSLEQTVRDRVPRPGRRMWRLCTGTSARAGEELPVIVYRCSTGKQCLNECPGHDWRHV